MGKDDLVTHVEELGDKIVSRFGGSYQWKDDRLHYHYDGGVTVWIQCGDRDVAVDVKLGMLMGMLKGKITKEIEDYLDNNIS